MSEVRSSEPETELSSNDNPMGVEVDTAVYVPREVRAFHTFGEVCGLDDEMLSRFWDRFQFPERVRVRLPQEEERACHFSPGEVCFYEAAFLCGLSFPVHPFIMELLGESLHITSEFLTQEAKVASVMSKMEALEAENSKLKKYLIVAMDKANTIKEKAKTLSGNLRVEQQLTLEKDEQLLAAKEKLKTIAAKAVEAF